MAARDEPLFLARETYRRRRIMDAARFLPFIGMFAFVIPVLWAHEAGTAAGMIYLFSVWVVLIVLSVVISRRLMGARDLDEPVDEGRDGPD